MKCLAAIIVGIVTGKVILSMGGVAGDPMGSDGTTRGGVDDSSSGSTGRFGSTGWVGVGDW